MSALGERLLEPLRDRSLAPIYHKFGGEASRPSRQPGRPHTRRRVSRWLASAGEFLAGRCCGEMPRGKDLTALADEGHHGSRLDRLKNRRTLRCNPGPRDQARGPPHRRVCGIRFGQGPAEHLAFPRKRQPGGEADVDGLRLWPNDNARVDPLVCRPSGLWRSYSRWRGDRGSPMGEVADCAALAGL